jgi:hypothetical protein
VASNRDERCRNGESHPGPWPVKPRQGPRFFVTDLWIRGDGGAAHLDPSERATSGRGQGSDDLRHVLADYFDCRSRRAALGPRGNASGLAPRPRRETSGRARSERAPEAGSRRQSRENGGGFPQGSTGRWKALWVDKIALFDEKALKSILALRHGVGFGPPRTGARQRASEVASRARLAVEKTAVGRRRSEGLSIAAPART